MAESLEKTLQRQKEAKYDKNLEKEIKGWVFSLLKRPVPEGAFQELLHDGTVLCELLNQINPDTIKKINKTTLPFKQMVLWPLPEG